MTNEVRLSIGNNTIVCEADAGSDKATCQNFVDPDDFIFRQSDAVRKEIPPNQEFPVKEVRVKDKEITFDQDDDKVMASNLSGKTEDDYEFTRDIINLSDN